ncbi:MAG: thioredoxin family protein [bacterium]|nr:thioredoxin family protein [bacterium]
MKKKISFLLSALFLFLCLNRLYPLSYEFLKEAKTRAEIRENLKALKNEVTLIVFTSGTKECLYCTTAIQIVRETASLSDKIKTRFLDMKKDKKLVQPYKVDRAPAILVTDGKIQNIRFYGLPAGYEYSSLLESIKNVSSGGSGLSAKNVKKLSDIQKKVLIRVFVTPTCPYCPMAVVTAHQIGLANSLITAEMIEANEFMDLSRKNNVSSVPKTVIINEKGKKIEFIGAYPEDAFVEKVLEVK